MTLSKQLSWHDFGMISLFTLHAFVSLALNEVLAFRPHGYLTIKNSEMLAKIHF